jgi:hypothetical protein
VNSDGIPAAATAAAACGSASTFKTCVCARAVLLLLPLRLCPLWPVHAVQMHWPWPKGGHSSAHEWSQGGKVHQNERQNEDTERERRNKMSSIVLVGF